MYTKKQTNIMRHKSFHVTNYHVRERIAQQEEKLELQKQKLKEREREREKEREEKFYREMGEKSGIKTKERLEWMYSNNIGKGATAQIGVDITALNEPEPEPIQSAPRATVVDIENKMREDPLLAMEQQRMKALQDRLSNPVYALALKKRKDQLEAEAKEKAKAEKKEKKEKKKKEKKEKKKKKSSKKSRRRSSSSSEDSSSSDRRPRESSVQRRPTERHNSRDRRPRESERRDSRERKPRHDSFERRHDSRDRRHDDRRYDSRDRRSDRESERRRDYDSRDRQSRHDSHDGRQIRKQSRHDSADSRDKPEATRRSPDRRQRDTRARRKPLTSAEREERLRAMEEDYKEMQFNRDAQIASTRRREAQEAESTRHQRSLKMDGLDSKVFASLMFLGGGIGLAHPFEGGLGCGH